MEKQQVIDLWQTCFQDDESFVSLYFSRVYKDENTIGYSENNKLVSVLQMIPYTMTFHKTEIKLAYISGAATSPDFRDRGLMTRLLGDAYKTMRKRGIPLSVLIPAQPWLYGYYGRMGYSPVFYQKVERYTSVHNFHEMPGFHRADVSKKEIYVFFDRMMKCRPCCVQHTFEDFEVICDDLEQSGGELVAMADDLNNIVALAFVQVHDGEAWIIESLYSHDKIKDILMGEVTRIFPGMSLNLIIIPSVNTTDNVRFGMARVIDAEKLLGLVAAAYPYFKCTIRLSDDILLENNGFFVISDGKCFVIDEKDIEPDYDINIETLASMLFGDNHVAELLSFPSQRPYMSLMLN